jgi:acylphosphatase
VVIAKRCFVAGRVQGVYYRASTQKQARSLAITGFARNLPDGRVEVLAIGEKSAVEKLVAWLWQGPPASEVTGVESVDIELELLAPLPTQFATG